MKKLIYIVLSLMFLVACKQQPKQEIVQKELSIAQRIANAHGFNNWQDVSKIQFTFNNKRSWIWEPKTDAVTLLTEKDTLSYNRKSVDSLSLKADRGFINDKFWLLIPFQLVWDKSALISTQGVEKAPISGVSMNKITLTYPNEGGYTPGDAYDIYYGDDFIIQEWVFRKGNQTKPSLINTFENYKSYNGIWLASDHKRKNSEWNLTLSNISIILDSKN